ncbi:MAG: DUF5689 domain-containing protein [Rikenellaceae bacterium]|nr:DUF5689 domain-containing protein [Rikenellaceae bacterium]
MAVVAVTLAACSVDKTPLGEISGDGDGSGGSASGGSVTIAALKSMYVDHPVTVTDEVSISGRIVSSDRWGNFYKTLCVEDATGGIAIRIDLEEYFRTFRLGAEVTVYCNALSLGTYGGAVQLGVLSGDGTNTVTYIPSGHVMSAFRLVGEGTEPPVAVVTIPDIRPNLINTYVEIREVQFEDGTPGLTWSEEGADTDRYITDPQGNRLAVRTSRYATFAGDLLPHGSGIIRGVVGYFNGSYQLTVINSHYAMMESERFEVAGVGDGRNLKR